MPGGVHPANFAQSEGGPNANMNPNAGLFAAINNAVDTTAPDANINPNWGIS